jgi:hypothetical protein
MVYYVRHLNHSQADWSLHTLGCDAANYSRTCSGFEIECCNLLTLDNWSHRFTSPGTAMRKLQPQQQALRACPCSNRLAFRPATASSWRAGRKAVQVRSTEDFVDPITGMRSCKGLGPSLAWQMLIRSRLALNKNMLHYWLKIAAAVRLSSQQCWSSGGTATAALLLAVLPGGLAFLVHGC